MRKTLALSTSSCSTPVCSPRVSRGGDFTQGVEFTFPETILPVGGYLVVAADVAAFKAAYSGVSSVIGGWTGQLGNSGQTIRLCDALGAVVDEVPYCDEGDWGVRELGPVDQGHRGWQWSDQTDGGGSSLELINPAMPNEYGQNWAASAEVGGTPGRVNSAAAADIAPLIERRHALSADSRPGRSRNGHGNSDRRIHKRRDCSAAVPCGSIHVHRRQYISAGERSGFRCRDDA